MRLALKGLNNLKGLNKMKRAGMMLAGALCAIAFTGVASEETVKKPESLRVLMIGNSFSISVCTYMPEVAKSMGVRLELGSLYIGGCSLQKHWSNWVASTNVNFAPYDFDYYVDGVRVRHEKLNLRESLSIADWDVVTFQQASTLSWVAKSYHPHAEKLQEAIRSHLPNAEFVWQETWSYLPWDPNLKRWKFDRNEMYARLHRAYADVAAAQRQRIVPTGTAIQLWRQKLPVNCTENSTGGDVCGSSSAFKKKGDGSFVYKGDTIHLNGYGKYLQALVWTAKLFGVDVRKCDYAPKWLPSEKAALMKEVAMEAVGETGGEDSHKPSAPAPVQDSPIIVRELKLGLFEAHRLGVGLGREFPGASGRIVYTNRAARLNFDFAKGGHYVTMGLGVIRDGVKKLTGVFGNSSSENIALALRVRDAKGDAYATGMTLRAGVTDTPLTFDFSRLSWRWGKSTNGVDRAHPRGPFVVEILCEPAKRGLAGAVEAKDLRLVTAASADIEPDWCFTRTPERKGAVFYAGEAAKTGYALDNLRTDGGAPYVHLVRAVVSNWKDEDVCVRELKEERGTLALSHEDLKCFGAFKIRFFGADAEGREINLGRTWFAYLTGKSKPTPWCGTGVHGWGDRGKYEQIARAGIGSVRNDYVWPGIEKSKGVYTPNKAVQRDIATMRELGIVPHMIFNGTNKLYENPVDHEAFSNFIRWALANDLKDVDTFEIWNESWNNYFGRKFGPYDKREWIHRYVAFSKSAAKTVHEARPDANVMVATEDGPRGLQWMIEEGIGTPKDIISFHPYVHKKDPRPERLHFFYDDEGETLRAWGKLQGVTRFRSTEAGWTTYSLNPDGTHEHWFVGDYPSVSYAEQAQYIIRAYLISRGCGLEAMMQYDFQDDGPKRSHTEHNFGLVFQDQTPKPSFAAVAFMTRLLGDAKPILGSQGDNYKIDRRYAFVLPDGRKAYAMWAVEKPVEVEIPSDGRGGFVFDLMGNRSDLGNQTKLTLTESPVYVVERK